jgi:hypothetical protein
VISFLNVKNITMDDWLANTCKRIHLTFETLTWDPNATLYEDKEADLIDDFGVVVPTVRPQTLIINLLSSLTTDLVGITDDDNFHQVLESHVMISSVDTSLAGHLRTRKTSPIDHLTLSAR